MTHRTSPGTERAVIMEVLGMLSPDEIATLTGKSFDRFYQIASPTNDYRIYLADAAAFGAAMEARGLPDRFLELYQQTKAAIQVRRYDGSAPAHPAVGPVLSAISEFAASIEQVYADGKLSPADVPYLEGAYHALGKAETSIREQRRAVSGYLAELRPGDQRT